MKRRTKDQIRLANANKLKAAGNLLKLRDYQITDTYLQNASECRRTKSNAEVVTRVRTGLLYRQVSIVLT